MRILVVSNTPWESNNSFGNSFGNIFDGIEDLQFANIYCREGQPDNKSVVQSFQITERILIENLKKKCHLFHFKRPTYENGKEGFLDKEPSKAFNQARKLRWQVLFWGRDLIWKIGEWKSPQLLKFIDDFKPDIIFQPIYYSNYLCDIVLFIKQYTGIPMLGYISDDNYTLRQFRFSPLYWIDRLLKRRKVKAAIEKCEILYVISKTQKEEYEKIFTPPCKILTKCADFSGAMPTWSPPNKEVRLIYAGNIGSGRWKSLTFLAAAIEKLCRHGYKVKLDIYTATPLTLNMKKELDKQGSEMHGAISYGQLQQEQKRADILVHVEGLSLKSRTEVHQSFSTKLVDYFAMGKCIFAIGTRDVASIGHLIENNAAIVAEKKAEVYEKIKELLDKPEMISLYGKKAYQCGMKHHDRSKIQNMLISDLYANTFTSK